MPVSYTHLDVYKRQIVCAKQVPDTNVIKINPKTGTLIRDGVPSILNHDDANALEEALKIKDKYPDTYITCLLYTSALGHSISESPPLPI